MGLEEHAAAYTGLRERGESLNPKMRGSPGNANHIGGAQDKKQVQAAETGAGQTEELISSKSIGLRTSFLSTGLGSLHLRQGLNCLELHQAGLAIWPVRSRYLLVFAFPGLAILRCVSIKHSCTKPHPSSNSCFSSVLKSRSRQRQRI